ncbi:MAG: serine hydrolase domain-containing protein [Longimicrobiales bacterium]
MRRRSQGLGLGLGLGLALTACAPPPPVVIVPGPAPEPAEPVVIDAPLPDPPPMARIALPPRMLGEDAAKVGMDPALLDSIDRVVRIGIRQGVSPGVALAIGRHGHLVRLRGYGRLDWNGMLLVTDSTLYDLASLTKVVATTTAAMILFDEGALELDARISSYLPEFGRSARRDSVRVRNLLTHTAGLPAWKPLYTNEELVGRANFYRRIAMLALEYSPGTRTEYSDLGMILMQAIVERITGMQIEDFLRDRVFGPLGMTDTHYSPLQLAEPRFVSAGTRAGAADEPGERVSPTLEPLLARIAPTEYSREMGGKIHGFVHDENAFAMGGVAGHAGLFSSARDLAIFAQMLLNGGLYDGRRIISERTVRLFTTRQSEQSSRALGWDTPDENSSAGAYFSAASFGHTGFTGTSIWIDPGRDLFVVLLTNRVNPTRSNQLHTPFRRQIHDLAQRAITDMSVAPRLNAELGY